MALPKLVYWPQFARFKAKIIAYIDSKTGSTDISSVTGAAWAQKNTESQQDAIYTATSTDGVTYTATIPGVTQLYAGLKIHVKFSRSTSTTMPKLDVNGLGAKGIRQPLSMNNAGVAPGAMNTWISSACPLILTYTGDQWKTDVIRPSASGLYGTVPLTSGGTGGTTAEAARANLGAASQADLEALMARVAALESK